VDDESNLLGETLKSSRSEESKLGFNMCECGFEGINIKVAKRSSNQVEEETIEEQEQVYYLIVFKKNRVLKDGFR
jgi:hypothetical protein